MRWRVNSLIKLEDWISEESEFLSDSAGDY